MVRPTLIDMNHVELKYYPFMISLNKCTGSCNVLSPKICVPKETKDINVKVFNITTNKDEPKAMTEHISCDCKCKFNSTICNSIVHSICNSNQKWNKKTCQCECKIYRKCKIIVGILVHVFARIVSILSVADTLVTERDEIIFVMDIVSTKKANTIATKKTNVTTAASINS